MEVEEIFAGRGEERRHTGRLHKIRFTQKIQALDSLAKYLGMFCERLVGADKGSFQIRIFTTSIKNPTLCRECQQSFEEWSARDPECPTTKNDRFSASRSAPRRLPCALRALWTTVVHSSS
jgi:hypothetical protein